MKIKILVSLVILSVILSPNIHSGCTTGVFSGKSTEDGRPLLWKHRDTGFLQNKIVFFDDGNYDYIGIVNSVDSSGAEVWIGYNSAGFAIMNSASYNLKPESDTTRITDREGVLMKKALQDCVTLKDFENLLTEYPKPLGVEANFGVIDSSGGAAYYEVDNFNFIKLDVNDTTIAPDGYLLHTNYSFTGEEDEGSGYIRYATADMLFSQAYEKNKISPQFIIQNVSRSLYHSLTKENIEFTGKEFVPFRDFIPRYYSSSSTVIQGSKPEVENDFYTMWTLLGFPLTTVAVPVWLQDEISLPEILTAESGENAKLADFSLSLKEKAFPVKRGSGEDYIKINELFNKAGTGITQKLIPLENKIFSETKDKLQLWRSGNLKSDEIKDFYNYIDEKILNFYQSSFDLSNISNFEN